MQGKITQVVTPGYRDRAVRLSVEVSYHDWIKSDIYGSDEVEITLVAKPVAEPEAKP